ncbi:MAG TPA: site-2 protease family protein [Gemmatimonadales bacterium]|nr:site-2 protease family protein [Gemmatimonadales bacterium]
MFLMHAAAAAAAASPVISSETLVVLALGVAMCWLAMVVHELGHALAALLLGVRIWAINLGIGPTIWSRTIRGCRVRIGLVPLVGSVQLLDADAVAIGYRDIRPGFWRFVWVPGAWRAPIISAAGGFANLLATVAFAAWALQPHGAGGLGQLLGIFGVVANFSGYLNLLPCFSSDGVHLLAHLRAMREAGV